MNVAEKIPGIEEFVRFRVEHCGLTHAQISAELQGKYPGTRGLSERNVRRFCQRFEIKRITVINDSSLDRIIATNVRKVGPQYGRKTMKGLLAAQGFRVGENRVSESLKRVHPHHQASRLVATERLLNPTRYVANYFGIDGFSKKIVGCCSMPIKNAVSVYDIFFRPIVLQYGLWDQVRVDFGTEWALLLHVQRQLSAYRHCCFKQPYLQTSSKRNHVVERMWVDINSRINYPVKKILLNMTENGMLNMEDEVVQSCVSYYSIHVCSVGLQQFIRAWNEHPLPGSRGCSRRGTPNQRMLQDCRTVLLDPGILPSSGQAVTVYQQCGGQLTEYSHFGVDPLALSPEKINFRHKALEDQCGSFDYIYSELINCNHVVFENGLKFFIDTTYRLCAT